jgi:hypothetical protein
MSCPLDNKTKIGSLARYATFGHIYSNTLLATLATASPAIVHIRSVVISSVSVQMFAKHWPHLQSLTLHTPAKLPKCHLDLEPLSSVDSLRNLTLSLTIVPIMPACSTLPPTLEKYSGIVTAAVCDSLCQNGMCLESLEAHGKWSDNATLNAFMLLIKERGAQLKELTLKPVWDDDKDTNCGELFETIGASCTSLETLDISNGRSSNYDTLDTLSTVLKGCGASLRSLTLEWDILYYGDSAGAELLRVSALCPNLTELDCSALHLAAESLDAVESVLSGNTLQTLVLHIRLYWQEEFDRFRNILLQCRSMRKFVYTVPGPADEYPEYTALVAELCRSGMQACLKYTHVATADW